MADNSNILSDFGINLLEEEIDDVIFQTNEFLCDATFYRLTRAILVDPANEYGIGRTVLDCRGGRDGVQDDGETRAVGRDETLQAVGGVGDTLLVVPTGRHQHDKQRQQLVRIGLFELHTQLHRQLHPRPVQFGSHANQ